MRTQSSSSCRIRSWEAAICRSTLLPMRSRRSSSEARMRFPRPLCQPETTTWRARGSIGWFLAESSIGELVRPNRYDSERRHRRRPGSAENNAASPVFRCANYLSALLEFQFHVGTLAGASNSRVQERGPLIAAELRCPIAPETGEPFDVIRGCLRPNEALQRAEIIVVD